MRSRPIVRRPPLSDGSPLAVWRRTEPAICYAWHYHLEFELVFIVSSQGRRFVGDSIEDYREGDLVLMTPGVPHSWASAPDCRANEQIVAHFHADIAGPSWSGDPALPDYRRLLKDAERGIWFPPGIAAPVGERLLSLQQQRPLTRLARFLDCLDILSAVPLDRRRCLSARRFSGGDERLQVEPAETICRFLEENFHRRISIDEAAAHMAMSPSAFSRFLRRALGCTFTEYLNELRVRHACRLLADTDDSIAAVASSAGFPNVSYFNRRFMQHKKQNPTAYRAAVRRSMRGG